MSAADPEQGEVVEASDLYGLPLERFTRARDGLARTLREEGRLQEASEVAALRKPTIDAWALNQVARRHPEGVAALAEAHWSLRDAADGEALRRASETRHRLFEELLESAASILDEANHSSSGPVRDRISRTLLAAASDPGVERALLEGVLSRTAEISDQWPGMALPAAPTSPPGGPVPTEQEVEVVEARARQLADHAAELAGVATEARQALDRAREEAGAAEQAARAAASQAREAEEVARKARRRRR